MMNEFNLFNQSIHIYNIDESGLSLNNRSPKFIAEKGKKGVNSLTIVERRENITVVTCCNASGNFIPPLVIVKGVCRRLELQTNLAIETITCMNDNYINEGIFFYFF